jgi:hypothetical protein
MEQNVLEERPRAVQTRFELAAGRMVESWIAAGRVCVSAGDMRLAREFLETAGWTIHDAPGARVRLVSRAGRAQEMTREAAVLIALRRLAARD